MDKAYFENYCKAGPYGESYALYSGIEHCISIVERFRLRVGSVMVLGAATGEVLRDFDHAWRIRPIGCEISRWAHGRIPARYRASIARADLRHYLRDCARRDVRTDLIFSNSLVYIDPAEVPQVLAHCRSIGRYLHFLSSTSEDFEPHDDYRKTLRPRAWWRERFIEAGFAPTRSRYLFR